MIIIYDFDGTLTPYHWARYDILVKNGYDNDLLEQIVKERKERENCGILKAYYLTYQDILKEKGIIFNKENVCKGAENVNFNKGVIEYFRGVQYKETGIKHYIVTSGFKDYICETPIKDYIQGVYGVTFKEENGKYTDIDLLLDSKKKVDAIKDIIEKNSDDPDIVYFGDGMTDKEAFNYVHLVGGRTVFIAEGENPIQKYEKINENGIIDKYFEPDYSKGSKIWNYIMYNK